jgi:hypothetical protein
VAGERDGDLPAHRRHVRDRRHDRRPAHQRHEPAADQIRRKALGEMDRAQQKAADVHGERREESRDEETRPRSTTGRRLFQGDFAPEVERSLVLDGSLQSSRRERATALVFGRLRAQALPVRAAIEGSIRRIICGE